MNGNTRKELGDAWHARYTANSKAYGSASNWNPGSTRSELRPKDAALPIGNAMQLATKGQSSKPVASALNFSCFALSRTMPTSASSKPDGASATTSSVTFTFTSGVRCNSKITEFRIASNDFTGLTMSISTEP